MGDPSFGGTLTGGIQDISALLPLLGTEQCEGHVSSALTKGYLYAAATPISIFGSLGMARAGFKTLVASISSRRFIGARTLTNMGFKPQGINLSLIMRDQAADSRYLVESRLDAMLKDLHIDDTSKVNPSMECTKWNTKMFLATAACCVLSITPYSYLNPHANMTDAIFRFRFPIIKAVGGFLVATMVQLIIQNRILVITTQSLSMKTVGTGLKELGMSLPKERKDSGLESDLQDLEWHVEHHRERFSEHIHDASNSQSKQSTVFIHWSTFVNCRNRCKQRSDIEKGNRKPSCESCESFLDHDEFQSPTIEPALEGTGKSESVTVNTTSSDQYEKLTELKDHLIKAQKVGLTHFEIIVCSALLLAGILASVVGYIGCFSAVQGSRTLKGPVIWLGLEATLSIIRFVLWGWNPDGDDLPPFTLAFKLHSPPLLPTCNKFAEEIDGWESDDEEFDGEESDKEKILPLVRAPEFLESITAYAGRLERFEIPNLALYYAITRKGYGSHERVLYIAIFDFVERTTRIYVQPTRDKDKFYSTIGLLEVDLEHAVLRIKIGNEINPNNDPVASNVNVRSLLAKHYRSILDEICSREEDQWAVDGIGNPWTFRTEDLEPKSPLPGKPDGAASGDEVSRRDELLYLNHGKLERLNRTLRKKRVDWIDEYMKWVEIDSKFYKAELARRQKGEDAWKVKKVEEEDLAKKVTRDDEQEDVVLGEKSWELPGTFKLEGRKKIRAHEMQLYAEGEADGKPLVDAKKGVGEVKELLTVAERWMMEVILFHEICGWEEKLSERYKSMAQSIIEGKDKLAGKHLEKMLERSQLSNAWIRLSEEKRAMEARWKNALPQGLLDQCVKYSVGDWRNRWNLAQHWDSALRRYTKGSGESINLWDLQSMLDNFLCQSYLEDKAQKYGGEWMQKVVQDWCEEMKCRLRCEIDEIEARLGRGLDGCREFTGSYEYFDLVHGSSKWLEISWVPSAEYLSTILKNIKYWRRDIPLISFGSGNDDELAELIPVIHDMTSVTTVHLGRNLVFGDKTRAALVNLITKSRSIISVISYSRLTIEIKEALQRNIDMLGTRSAISFESADIGMFGNLEIGADLKEPCFTLRFLAPVKGNLILQLRHRSYAGATLKIKEVESFQHQVPDRHILEDIILSTTHFTPGQKTKLTFVAVPTNRFGSRYYLSDIQLLDEAKNPYNATQQNPG